MRRFSLVALLFLSPLSLYAQISITSADVQGWFAVGKSWTYLNSDSNPGTMNVGTASESAQTWIVPSIARLDTFRMDNVSPSSTPYASSFPRATHCQYGGRTDQDALFTIYNFYRFSADSLIQLGTVHRQKFLGLDTTYVDVRPEPLARFPLALGGTLTRRDSVYSGPGQFSITTETEVYDAFGSMTVLGRTYQALRSKSTEIRQRFLNNAVVQQDTLISFMWFAKEGVLVELEAAEAGQSSGQIPLQSLLIQIVSATPVGIAEDGRTIPTTPQLLQNYPNPFNPTTTIRFALPQAERVTIKIFDLLGREVRMLVDAKQDAGDHSVVWDGSSMPSGAYICRMQAGSFRGVRRILLLR